MPINRLILEIDDQSMMGNFVTFNMIDYHQFSLIVFFGSILYKSYYINSRPLLTKSCK